MDKDLPRSLIVCVTFYYRTERIKYLSATLANLPAIAQHIQLVIVTQTLDADEREQIIRVAENYGMTPCLVTPNVLGHPYLLTWCHLEIFRRSLQSHDQHTHFLYLEDDVIFGLDNM